MEQYSIPVTLLQERAEKEAMEKERQERIKLRRKKRDMER